MMTNDPIWVVRERIGEKWGALIVLLYLPLHFLAFYSRQSDSTTKIGLLIRAGVQDREMVEALGYRIKRLFIGVFAVGSALGYLDFRFPGINWRNSHPNLAKLQEKLMQKQSFLDTIPV